MKKILSIILSIVMTTCFAASLSASKQADSTFVDISEDKWYYEYVKTAYENGIMNGKGDNIFDPDAYMSRSEFVTVLCRISDNEYEGDNTYIKFDDTEKDEWYSDSVGWAVKNKLVVGYDDNTFRPNSMITRQEMAVILDRFMSFRGIRDKIDPKTESYTDAANIPDWAADGVETLRINGIAEGDENGCYNPEANATRAELAKIASIMDMMVYKTDRYKGFRFNEAFDYSGDDSPLPYRIYIPKDYDETKEYPFLLFLHANAWQGDDNEIQLDAIKNAFLNPYSPVLDGIVVLPQCPENNTWYTVLDKLAELMDYINDRYSTDSSRQYVSGLSMGGDGSWQMAMYYPEKVSAILPVAGVGYGFMSGVEGPEGIINLNSETLKVNIRMLYDMDDKLVSGEYCRELFRRLTEAGAVNFTYQETTGYGHGICGELAGWNNISHLEWLYSQVRETVRE